MSEVAASSREPIATLISTRGTAAAPLTVTERNFLRAMFYTAIIVVVFTLGWAFERFVLKRQPGDIRFIREGSEAAMRYITIPHIIIGFLFMWSSPKNRNARQRLWAVGLLMLGAALCTVYGMGGGKTNFILYSGVYLYFLVHELRDEAMFYTVLGDAPPIADRKAFQGLVRAMTGLIVVTLGAFLWSGAPWGFYGTKVPNWAIFDGSLTPAAKAALAFGPLVLLPFGYVFALRHFAARLGFGDVRTLIRTHIVLFRVMLGVAAVLGLALLITQRAFSLILFHVVAWYIFAAHQFLKHPPKVSPNGLWLWMRTTVSGFKLLHIGMVVVLMAVGLVWTLGMDRSPSLAWLLAPESFLYWTIMHITVSFVPR